MAIFRCKMCGGELEIQPGSTVAECTYCGAKQTLPKLDDEKRFNLYDRANHFRRNNEFDKAMGIYEHILNEDKSDAEAYWSLVLCRYGIEYVEDPASHKRVPTVNRAQFTSIFDDEDYKAALEYADITQRPVYEAEAAAINEIQKGILEISQKEEPFDVFICYKETDPNGRRTPDSVLANELYHELTNEGFKVFFARITLEDKLGTAYEPYIFAALNSAKVMVVLGTKAEYFNAVWVKNEWSRYLSLIKSGAKKTLIPAYRDMDPYDLPEEFSHLQAQDMSKLGFMPDLVRGIKKLAQDAPKAAPVKETVVVQSEGGANAKALLERGNMALEDGEFDKANDFFEQILNMDAHCGAAYLGQFLAAQKCKTTDEYVQRYIHEVEKPNADVLTACDEDFNGINACIFDNVVDGYLGEHKIRTLFSFERTYLSREADSKRVLEEEIRKIEMLKKEKHLARAAQFGVQSEVDAISEKILSALRKQVEMYRENAEKNRQQIIEAYPKHIEDVKKKVVQMHEEALKKKAADEKTAAEKAEAERIAAEKAARKRKKIVSIVVPIVAVCIAVLIVVTKVIIPNSHYNAAVALMDAGKYDDAIAAFEVMNGYKDSIEQIESCYIGKYGEENWNTYKNFEIGDTYIFGTYEQDNNTSNGAEDIEWLILDKTLDENGPSLLVISAYALDCQPYNTSHESITWENCTLREWLNEEFLNSAFSSEEQAMIPEVIVTADENPEYSTDPVSVTLTPTPTEIPALTAIPLPTAIPAAALISADEENPDYSTNPGNDTTDRVFLLSINEAEEYFTTDEDRMCVPTDYAIAQGANTSSSKTKCGAATGWWWLRSPGNSQYHAALVDCDSSVLRVGRSVSKVGAGVRPAMWISLSE